MSLINEVLRDLDERRRGQPDAEPEDGFEGLRPAPSAPRRRLRRVLPEAISLLLLVALLLSIDRDDAVQPPSDFPVPTPDVAAAFVPQAPAQELLAPNADAASLPIAQPERPAPRPAAAPRKIAAAPAPARTPGPGTSAARSQAGSEASPSASEPAASGPAPSPSSAVSTSERAQHAYREALDLAASGDEKLAREKLERCLALEPRHRDARSALAMLRTRSGDGVAALALLDQGRQQLQDPAAFFALEARIRAELGDLAGAVALLESPLLQDRLDDESAHQIAELRALLAALYQRQGRAEKAARLYAEALRSDPAQARWWLGLGVARESRGQSEQAVAAYRRAWQAPELDADTRHWMADRIRALSASGTPR